MASGKDLPKTHHRSSTKLIKDGEPVFLCFCGMTNFHKFIANAFWKHPRTASQSANKLMIEIHVSPFQNRKLD